MGDKPEFTHKQALNRMKDINEEIERLGGKDDLVADDEKHWAELVREFESLDKHRKNLEREADLSRVRAILDTDRLGGVGKVERGTPLNSMDGYDHDPILNPDSVEDHRFQNPWDLSEMRTFGRSKEEVGQELRSRALSAIEKMSGTNDRVRAGATNIIETFDSMDGKIAKLCLATSSPEYMRAWSKLAMNRGHMLTDVETRALERAMSLTDSAGGYLVPFQLDPTVIISSSGSRNEIRRVARQVVATGDVWNGVTSDAVSWSWDAEGAEVSDDTTTFTQPTIPIYKAAGFIPISIEALQDEANVTQEVARLLAFGRDTLESAAFATGTGSAQPTGVVTALGAGSIVTSTTTDVFAVADIYKIDQALPARFRGNASWLGNRSIYNLVRQFGTADGHMLWERLGADVPALLMGAPVYESEDMDGSITPLADNKILVYGDFESYVIADRVGMTVEFIPHLFHTTTNRPSGSRGWYAYYRVGADSVNDNGLRVLNVT